MRNREPRQQPAPSPASETADQSATLEHFCGLRPGNRQRRDQARNDGGPRRQNQAEQQHPGVDSDVAGPLQIRGEQGPQKFQSPGRESHTQEPAQQRQHQGFQQPLAQDPTLRRPQGEAHRHLRLAAGPFGEQHAHDIHASHQQEEPRRKQQKDEPPEDVAPGTANQQRHWPEDLLKMCAQMRFGHAQTDGSKLCLCRPEVRRQGTSRLQPAQNEILVPIPEGLVPGEHQGREQLERTPAIPGREKLKTRRRNADDFVRFPIDYDVSSNQRGIAAKTLFPQFVSEHHHASRGIPLFSVSEPSSHGRSYA